MRLPITLLATAATAIVIPQSWSEFEHRLSPYLKTASSIISTIENKADEIKTDTVGLFFSDVAQDNSVIDQTIEHDYSDLTIYELISLSDHAKEFTKWVNKHKSVVEILNSTETNKTLFVPIDGAFENIPDHHKKPSDEFVEAALKYHIGVGSYPAGRILVTHTIPSAYNESWLGGEPQRLRTSVGLSGVRVNVYSKVVAVNFKTKNGYVHAINKILLPPPMVGKELSLLPSYFSTLLLAYEKTNFVDFIHHVKMVGSTVFAPDNHAWSRLGPKANAFLFNTECGNKYLKALLKYQIVANTTLYSDEIYYGDEQSKSLNPGHLRGQANDFHIELPTLLEDKSLGVDIRSWKGWSSIVVNGANAVSFQDGVAKNGVIQVLGSVPIPPHRHGKPHRGGVITVEELKERLSGYVEPENEAEFVVQDL